MKSGDFPRGIEVLVKKAAVDAAFKQMLLDRREEAAEAIHLTLEPAEVAMLQSVSRDQLETTIAQTKLSEQYRGVFLGDDAAAMLSFTEESTLASIVGTPYVGVARLSFW